MQILYALKEYKQECVVSGSEDEANETDDSYFTVGKTSFKKQTINVGGVESFRIFKHEACDLHNTTKYIQFGHKLLRGRCFRKYFFLILAHCRVAWR